MTAGEFADLVGRMRAAQVLAERTRAPEAWLEKSRLEREVDGILLDRRRRAGPRLLPGLEGGQDECSQRP